MPKAFDTWKVLAHEPLDKLTNTIWSVSGNLPNMALNRLMTIVRMQDGRLLVHNAMALEEELMSDIEAWGKIAFIVVPNGWHRLDCAVFKKRYPDARIVCPAGGRKKVEEVVPVDLTYDDFKGDETVSFEHMAGLNQAEGVMKIRSEDGVTLVFNDLVFNVPHQGGFTGLVFRVLGSTGGPRVTRIMRFAAVKDKRAVREHLERLAETPDLVRIIPGHGLLIDRDVKATLHAVASGLS